ncbi:MAG: hypothetical protein MSC30_19405 [Gaiellaceae bacterium MAG52_C11]|nr:hypothetical protein [Candidatus Gaiellasilicea maunaloa]
MPVVYEGAIRGAKVRDPDVPVAELDLGVPSADVVELSQSIRKGGKGAIPADVQRRIRWQFLLGASNDHRDGGSVMLWLQGGAAVGASRI